MVRSPGEDIQILPTSLSPLIHIVRDNIKQSKLTFITTNFHGVLRTELYNWDILDKTRTMVQSVNCEPDKTLCLL